VKGKLFAKSRLGFSDRDKTLVKAFDHADFSANKEPTGGLPTEGSFTNERKGEQSKGEQGRGAWLDS